MNAGHRRLAPGLAAATAVLVPLALTGCGDARTDDTTRDQGADRSATATAVAESAPTSEDAAARLPDDFPLAAALPATNGDDGTPVRVTDRPGTDGVELCGDQAWTPDETLDVAGVTYAGEAEDFRGRTLALYADDAAAAAALDRARDAFAACPAGTVGGTDQVYEEVASGRGAVTYTHRYRYQGSFDTGLEVIQVVQVGPALYLASYYGEGGGSPATIASSVEEARRSSRPVVEAMSDLGADTPDTTPEAADVPLAAGWPTGPVEAGSAGVEVPVDELDASFADHACDAPAPAGDPTEVVRGQFSDVETYLTRELLTFADADAAVAHVAGLRDFYAACPTRTVDGFSHPVRTFDTAVGGQSFAVVRSTEHDAHPAIGVSALQVVRVGSAVLLDTVSTEGSASDEAAAHALADAMAEESGDVVAAMCAFTEAGC
ncbi:hypothetical protein FE634_06605 [Nocardioides dongxiaopingii]|uniref:hypothetical protein n=1 Tax=Nocardioides sp. S-1144 TaxID=2582905 RepID=UPI00110F176F|nr:hypothetical protein [Nocardioides sp. S-1144]QCW50160.1 hypothetical protein FE634_06605 [Nocardioides sp. S-1144]